MLYIDADIGQATGVLTHACPDAPSARTSRALQCCQTANQIQPHDSTYLQMGAVHAERGDVEAALHTYLEALEHSPDNPELLTTLGVTFLRWAAGAC
jgi:Flp pilus assembly protein TadD